MYQARKGEQSLTNLSNKTDILPYIMIEAMPNIVCQKCGFTNPSGMRFCGNCGERLPLDSALLETQSLNSNLLPAQVGVMQGADLLERFRQAGLDAAGQHRNVTILFVDLSGFTAFSQRSGNEESFTLIQKFTNRMARDVYKYDGMVDKFLGDGLMAIFGAPIAHENNTELAIRAALDMRADIEPLASEVESQLGLNLKLHIGLHSGPVVVGSLGTDMLMNYTAIGDTVNTAYRLLQVAEPGQILASQSVFQSTQSLVDFQSLESVPVKGISDPLPVFAVTQLKPQPGVLPQDLDGLRASLIGRTRELNLLRRAQESLIARKEGRLVWVRGEAGIGKSRLVFEFIESLRQAGLRSYVAHSFIYRRALSYWMFQDLLSSLLQLTLSGPADVLRTSLANGAALILGGQAEALLPYLEYLLSLPPATDAIRERLNLLDAAQLRQQIFLAVRDLLVAAARRSPLVIIFEDLHWADEASLDLLRFLIDSVKTEPLLLVCLSRPTDNSGMLQLVDRANRTLSERFLLISLESLSASQGERLLDEFLSGPDLPLTWRAEILNQASGNPFFLEEIVRMLIDSGLIRCQDGKWHFSASGPAKLGVPDSLQGLILARFDRLNPYQRHLLQTACVIGRDFSAPLLEAVLPPTADRPMVDELSQLVERGFLSPLLDSSDSSYRFTHTLVSDTLYTTMLTLERRDLHGRVAKALEGLATERLDESVELLARHYSLGDCPEKALYYLILAGEKAARGFVNLQARESFAQALAIIQKVEPSLDQLLRIHSGLGDVLMRAGEYGEAREAYLTALRYLESDSEIDLSANAASRASLHRKLGNTCERQGDYAQALSELSAARTTLEELRKPSPVERAWILNDTGWVHFRRGDLDGANKALLEALHLVEEGPNYDLVASIYNRLGGVSYQKDEIDLASNYVRKSLFLRQEIGDSNGVARSYNNLGLLRWKRGDWDSALDDFNRSLKLHANLGDVEGTVELHANLGLLHLDRGNFEEARQHLETGLGVARQIGHSYHVGLSYLHFCRMYVMLENWEKALEYCRLGFQAFNEIGVMEYLVDLNTYAGFAYLGLGDAKQAEKCAGDALELFLRLNGSAHSGVAEDRGRALRLLGQVSLARGQYDRAAHYLKESESIFKHVGNQIEQGRTAMVQAQQALNTGLVSSARLYLNDARMIFRQLGARVDLKRLETLASHLG